MHVRRRGAGPGPALPSRPSRRSTIHAPDARTRRAPGRAAQAAARATGGAPRGRVAPWLLSALLHAAVLGLLVGLYAEGTSPERRPLVAPHLEFVEPRQEEALPEGAPSPPEVATVEFDWVEARPSLPDDPPPPDPVLPDEPPAAPARPPLQLLAEVPIEAVRVRVKVAPPERLPPPPPPLEVAQPPRRQPGAPLRVVFRPDLGLYYPREMQLRGIEGSALVRIAVDPRGVVVQARIVQGSGWPLLDRQALRVLYDYRFAPGDGGEAEVPVNFTLR